MLPDTLGVYRALTEEYWINENGEVTPWAFLIRDYDKGVLSLLGDDRIVPGKIEAYLRSKNNTKPILGVAESIVEDIRQCRSCITGGALDVVRTDEEHADLTEPHCGVLGLTPCPDPKKKKPLSPTDDQWDDATALNDAFENILPWPPKV